MKKALLAFMLSAIVYPALAADPEVFALRLSMLQGDRVVTNWTTSAGMGHPAEVKSLEYLQYDEACTGDSNGRPQFKKAQIELGLNATMRPVLRSAEGIAVQVDLRHVDLNSMNRKSLAGGCGVDLPSTHAMSVSGHMVLLRAGQKIQLPAGSDDKYRFTLERM
jgi:hypothetical protein